MPWSLNNTHTEHCGSIFREAGYQGPNRGSGKAASSGYETAYEARLARLANPRPRSDSLASYGTYCVCQGRPAVDDLATLPTDDDLSLTPRTDQGYLDCVATNLVDKLATGLSWAQVVAGATNGRLEQHFSRNRGSLTACPFISDGVLRQSQVKGFPYRGWRGP